MYNSHIHFVHPFHCSLSLLQHILLPPSKKYLRHSLLLAHCCCTKTFLAHTIRPSEHCVKGRKWVRIVEGRVRERGSRFEWALSEHINIFNLFLRFSRVLSTAASFTNSFLLLLLLFLLHSHPSFDSLFAFILVLGKFSLLF